MKALSESAAARVFVLAALLALHPSGARAQAGSAAPQRGFGPVTMKTARGEFPVRLLRRDKDMLWLLQQTQSGQWVEAGTAVAQIETFVIPPMRLFEYARAVEKREQMEELVARLERFFRSAEAFRDLPGIPADQALLLKGRLLEKLERWREALAAYQNILAQSYKPEAAGEARLRSGLCRARLGEDEAALEDLNRSTVDQDDIALLSEVWFAKGGILARLGRHKEAILSYLHLVVFHPFEGDNEPRCLAAAVPSYIALEDWEAALKTLKALRGGYPDSEYAAQAARALDPYREQLEKEKLYLDQGEAEKDQTEKEEPESEGQDEI